MFSSQCQCDLCEASSMLFLGAMLVLFFLPFIVIPSVTKFNWLYSIYGDLFLPNSSAPEMTLISPVQLCLSDHTSM